MSAYAIEHRLPFSRHNSRLPVATSEVIVEFRSLIDPLPPNLVNWMGDESNGTPIVEAVLAETNDEKIAKGTVRISDLMQGSRHEVSIRLALREEAGLEDVTPPQQLETEDIY